jgi:predicted CopG family antitoxin
VGFKTLTISEEAYRKLAKLKGRGESFTDIILKLTEGRGDILRHAGGWKEMTDEEARELEGLLRKMWPTWKPKTSGKTRAEPAEVGERQLILRPKMRAEQLLDKPRFSVPSVSGKQMSKLRRKLATQLAGR